MKFIAKDHTMILEIEPEAVHSFPKAMRKRSSPNKMINNISEDAINPTRITTGLRSLIKLSFLLNFSETFCRMTLVREAATKARGIDNTSFERSKKPADSGEKYLFINIGGRR